MRQLTIMVMMIIIILLIIISQRFINKYLNTQPGYARQSKHNDCGGSVGGRRSVVCQAVGGTVVMCLVCVGMYEYVCI